MDGRMTDGDTFLPHRALADHAWDVVRDDAAVVSDLGFGRIVRFCILKSYQLLANLA